MSGPLAPQPESGQISAEELRLRRRRQSGNAWITLVLLCATAVGLYFLTIVRLGGSEGTSVPVPGAPGGASYVAPAAASPQVSR